MCRVTVLFDSDKDTRGVRVLLITFFASLRAQILRTIFLCEFHWSHLSNCDSSFCFRSGVCLLGGRMDKLRRKFLLIFFTGFIVVLFLTVKTPTTYRSIPKPRGPSAECPPWISEDSITPLNGTKHLLVSAYMDQRVKGFDIRIIGMFKRDSIQPLYCLFCCAGWLSTTTPATISQHSDNFGFPFVTTDVMCPIPENCTATHVSLLTKPDRVGVFNQPWLPIRNKKEENKLQFDFTVCVSNLFGDYNNVLQFAQTLEMYRWAQQQQTSETDKLNIVTLKRWSRWSRKHGFWLDPESFTSWRRTRR